MSGQISAGVFDSLVRAVYENVVSIDVDHKKQQIGPGLVSGVSICHLLFLVLSQTQLVALHAHLKIRVGWLLFIVVLPIH